jgi:hypothetical protein
MATMVTRTHLNVTFIRTFSLFSIHPVAVNRRKYFDNIKLEMFGISKDVTVNEMGGSCSAYVGGERCVQGCSGNT